MCVNTHSHEGWEMQGFAPLPVFHALEQEGKKTAVGCSATYALKSPGNFRPNAIFWPPTVLVLAKNLRGGAWGYVFSQEGPRIIFVCSIRSGARFVQMK